MYALIEGFNGPGLRSIVEEVLDYFSYDGVLWALCETEHFRNISIPVANLKIEG